MKNKVKNPLIKRIPRELAGEWKKYLVVGLFLILTIGFVSGMYVANGSMMRSADEGVTRYKLEDGHFELDKKAGGSLLSAIETGKRADVKQYYTDKAKDELDSKFEKEFKKEFNGEFTKEFDEGFEGQIRQQLTAGGIPDSMLETAVSEAVRQAKSDDTYKKAYDKAYKKAWKEAYDKAYDKAWEKLQKEIDEEYADAEEKYELDDTDFKVNPVKIYENFYKNADEDNNNDGKTDGTIRVFKKTEDINLACVMEGTLPENEDEIAIDRMHADNAGIRVGDKITVSGEPYKVTGTIAYVNYATLHEKSTDLMFDALKFDVAMVTDEGFGRLKKTVSYVYAWEYNNKPADEKEEKAFSDDFMKALLTQSVVSDNELKDYTPKYVNPAINFATDDMGSDKSMGGVLLDILIVIIAFIFAVTICNTITKESSAIGTLRASGYSRGELVRHYLTMPVIVTLISAVIGNLLGYTLFKYSVVAMYYNSYSLPSYKTVWNAEAFVKTTFIPVVLMLAVNLIVITKMMRHTPLQFLRHDLKKTKRRKAMRLPRWSFMKRFRIRIILQNIPNYAILFIGIVFIAVMLAMAVGMPESLDYYNDNAKDMMFAKYQYVLKSYEDEDGKEIHTDNKDAEKFDMCSLIKKGDTLDEEISVYGIESESSYVDIKGLSGLKAGEAYISESFRDKYNIAIGDTVVLDEKYESIQRRFRVIGTYGKCQSLAVFMPVSNYEKMFGLKDGEFSGFLSDSELKDIDEDNIVTVITKRDITKICDQLKHSMGSYMQYFQVLCILLSAVLIYLLTKIIIEKNENAISMTKILGYENREIAGLYLLSTTIMVVVIDVASIFIGGIIMSQAWKMIMYGYSGWFTFILSPEGYAKMFAFILLGYLLVMAFDFRRIKKVPMDEALKNVE